MTVLLDRAAMADPLTLIHGNLLDRLVRRIADEHHTTSEHARRIMRQTIGFLAACALNPDAGLSPSREVDKGWHAFMLYTREYATFCDRVAGTYIHHAPDDPADADTERPASERIGATVAAMRAAGLPVDPALWLPGSDCSQCYAGCSDDPARGGN